MNSLLKSRFVPGAVLAACLTLSSAHAAPLVSPMTGVDVFFLGEVGGSYNSNILSANGGRNKVDDWIVTFSPGIEVKYGGTSKISLDATYTENFYRYTQHPNLNENLSNVNVELDYGQTGDKFYATENFSYNQQYNNNPSAAPTVSALGQILRSDILANNVGLNYTMDKFQASTGFDFSRTTNLGGTGANFNNNDSYTVPASFYYVYTEKLAFGIAYSYNQTDVKNSAAINPITLLPVSPGTWRETHNASFSTRFTDWNKLNGNVNVGVTSNYIPSSTTTSSQTTTTVGYGIGLSYDYSEVLSFGLNGNRGFSTGSAGQNIENTSVGITATYDLTTTVAVILTPMNYTNSKYLQATPSRTDDIYNSGVTVAWKPTSYLTLTAGYSYFMDSSKQGAGAPAASYNIHTVNLTASIRY